MVANSDTVIITSIDNFESIHNGAWVRYVGHEVQLNVAGTWPVYAPPSRVVRRNADGTFLWVERHPYYDIEPQYTWEEYREYLESYRLPVTLFNAHRNGRVDSSKSSSCALHHFRCSVVIASLPDTDYSAAPHLSVGCMIQYPRPDPAGEYSLDPRFIGSLELEFSLSIDIGRQVVVVYPFPYHIAVVAKTPANSTFRDPSKTFFDISPWRSLRLTVRGITIEPYLETPQELRALGKSPPYNRVNKKH